LALNAAIEAARAGRSLAAAFAVVADEVRDLSGRTNQFSQQIRKNMTLVHDSVQSTGGAIDEMASQDMNFALQSKQQVEDMMAEVQRANAAMAVAAGELATITAGIEQNVGVAAATLQCQDPVTGLLEHAKRRVGALDGISDKIGALARDLSARGAPALDSEKRAQGLRLICAELIELLAKAKLATAGDPAR
jgi:methyl-accepting chemotaxis protein